MSGIGYQWVHGKMMYSAQLGLGYSFNSATLEHGRRDRVRQRIEPVSVSVSNSFVRAAARSRRSISCIISSACARS